jgi:phospholipid-binding lipoprotein MlaA
MKPALPLRRGLAALGLVLLAGCATAPAGKVAAPTPATIDPWENWNRKVFAFNESLDANVLKPVAEGYRKVVPSLVRTGVNNVLGNVRDVWSTANQFLQGKVQLGLEMGMRVLSNTLFGLGGLLDPASEMGLTKRSEDFGQTLGRWGLGTGPFVVLPLFGPSTLRDTAGLTLDLQASPSRLPDTTAGRYSVTALHVVNTRTNLLATGSLIDQVALDKYSFIRDAYLARRRDEIYDGAPPMETFDDQPDDVPAAAAAPASAASAAARAAPAASAATAPSPATAASAASAASAPAR